MIWLLRQLAGSPLRLLLALALIATGQWLLIVPGRPTSH